MLVLGIDPGTATTGWGLVSREDDTLTLVAYGTVSTSSDEALPQRLQTIYRELTEIVAHHQPGAVAVERLFFNKNARTAMAVGQARGVALLAVADAGVPFHEYTPLEVKQSVCGYGRASKEQIQKLVQILLGLDSIPQPDDAADALAVAICHLHSSRLAALVAEQDRAS
ncbi:MAG: crossover junction endodeoxyribonuclease RuvC [Anaerolineae bacterium]|nr:crossover junction endodeoxyribonuclease RuvC [Anaerolineae bacterium]